MKHMIIKHAIAAIALVGLAACSSDQVKADKTQSANQTPQCGSKNVQRILTYCVSPSAAKFAKEADEVRQMQAKGVINPKVFPLPVGKSPTMGPQDATVTVMVFSDLECPYCSEAHKSVKELAAAYPKDVRVVYKHFPLNFHPNAKPAALAAHAAYNQGKFFEFVDAAYAKQENLSEQTYLAIAKDLKLNIEQFKTDMNGESAKKALAEDMGLASALNLQGTPSIFLNGVMLPGAVPLAQMKPVIEQQKKIVQAFLDAGVPKSEVYWRMVRAQYQPLPEPEKEEPEIMTAYIPVLDSPSKGASVDEALVTIVVFSDFECPYCSSANPAIYDMIKKYPKQVRVVFKHFPLPFHKQADEAAALSIVAQRTGKFWEMHDLLFQKQEKLDNASLAEYAKQLKVPVADVAKLVKDQKIQGIISRDMSTGIKAGVNGTPTFFVNGSKQVGVMQSEGLAKLVDAEIKAATALKTSKNLKAEALYEAIVKAKLAKAPKQ